MTKRLHILFLASLAFFFSSPAFAEYFEPPRIKPITYKGIKYQVVKDPLRGYFQAIDSRSGKALYETTLYQVLLKPGLEKDSQYIFLTGMRRKHDKLLFTDQGKRVFEFDITTRNIREISKHTIQAPNP